MNKEIKLLLKEIDSLLDKSEKKNEVPSEEVVDLLEQISNDLLVIKEQKKTKLDQSLVDKLDKLINIASEGGSISTETSKSIVSAIEKIKLVVPAPQVNVEPPKVEVTVPPIKVPQTKVTVPTPIVNVPEVLTKRPSWFPVFPSLKPIIDGIKAIKDAIVGFVFPTSARDAIAVRLSDGEKFYRAGGGIAASAISAFPFNRLNAEGKEEPKTALVDDGGHQQVDVLTMPGVTVVNPTDVSDLATSDNQINGLQQTMIKEAEPTDTTKTNPSTAYSYDGDGNLQYKDITIDTTTYRKTYTYTSGVLTAKSAYVAI